MHWSYRISLRFLRSFFLPFWVPHVNGLENLPREGPVILISNHPTVLDGLVLGSILPRQVRFLVSHEPFKVPLVGRWLLSLGFLPVGGKSGAIERTLDCLRNGDCIGVYPEGVPTHGYVLKSFSKGAAVLAQASGAPVVPVTIYGSEELCPEDCRYVKGGHVWITFGEALYWQSEDSPEGFLERVKERIRIPLSTPPAPLERPRDWPHRLTTALWTPISWALLKLADFARPGGKR